MPRKKRPSSIDDRRSAYSTDSEGRPAKRGRHVDVHSCSITNSRILPVYLVTAKLSPSEVIELKTLVDQHNSSKDSDENTFSVRFCSSIQPAEVVITAIRIRQRLERHIDWQVAKDKAFVTPLWLVDSLSARHVLPCGNYAAIRELHDETVENCPEDEHSESENDSHTTSSGSSRQADGVAKADPIALAPSNPLPVKGSKLTYLSRYSCQRWSPLICPNQALVDQLLPIMHSRELEGDRVNALSYERAIAVTFPRLISQDCLDEVSALYFVGPKTMIKITEFLQMGYINEAKTILQSERYKSLSAFARIYGIGPAVARSLYDTKGLRSLRQLRQYYTSITDGSKPEPKLDYPPTLTIPEALSLEMDLNQKVSREEVESIHSCVMTELAYMQDGYISTIVGGYRRGKKESNDIDIVISHRDSRLGKKNIAGVSKILIAQLYAKGLVKHVMHLSSFREPHALRTGGWDSLEKALLVFQLPPDPEHPEIKRINRRLDLIFAAPECYWTAVVGWTGSKMFERDLRKWAKDKKNLKFDSSGITRRHDSHIIVATTEEDVFRILGLDWIPPELRNADA